MSHHFTRAVSALLLCALLAACGGTDGRDDDQHPDATIGTPDCSASEACR